MSEAERARQPIHSVLPGMGLHPLPQGWTPIEAFVIIKALDDEGEATWSYRTTSPPNREELLGVLEVQASVLKGKLAAQWTEGDEDDD